MTGQPCCLVPRHPCCVGEICCTLCPYRGEYRYRGLGPYSSFYTNSCEEAVFRMADVCCVFMQKPDLACSSWQVPSPSLDVAEAHAQAHPEEAGAGGEGFPQPAFS